MAQTMICDGLNDGPADYLVTRIDTGDVNALCTSCMADFCQAYLQVIDPSRLAPPPEEAKKPASTKTRSARSRATTAKGGQNHAGTTGTDTAQGIG